MGQSFDPLTEAEAHYVGVQLDRARDFALAFDPQAAGVGVSLESLDRAFENYLATGNPRDANGIILAVGAAFGAALVEALDFRWVIAVDEYGTDLAILARPGRAGAT